MEPALSFLGTINLITIFLWPILKQLCSSGPLAELIQDEDVKEKLLEAARTFFTSSTVTVNLLPAALAAGAALLLAIPLLALLFPGLLGGLLGIFGLGGGGGGDSSGSGYGAPSTGYGASSSYSAPSSSYGAPSSSYESQYRSVSASHQKCEMWEMLCNVWQRSWDDHSIELRNCLLTKSPSAMLTLTHLPG